MSSSGSKQSSIVVAVRIRPFNDTERPHLIDYDNINNMKKPTGIWKIVDCLDDKMLIFDPQDRNPLNMINENILNSIANKHVKFNKKRSETKFIFDKLFDDDSTQEQIFEDTTRPLLDSVLDGFNGTVFAYGATGCGKTYTINGTSEDPGIIFRTMNELFGKIEILLQDSNRSKIEISLSYLEIYNETIRDLLKPETPSKKLIIREDQNSKISVTNLSYHRPENVQDVIDLVIRGNLNRSSSPTEANEVSSRSHSVLQIHVKQVLKNFDDIGSTNQIDSTLSIIDLAGSERAITTKNRGIRLYEGANINKSLLALGNCINALCINKKSCHIPYRDSKLTRLLKFSLGGNCKTVMIVCVSPSSLHYDETLNTLKYANRAKEIKTKVIRNQTSLNRHVGSYLKLITEQKQEIDKLKAREDKIVNMEISKYNLTVKKIEMSISDIGNNLNKVLANSGNFKTMKSLMLVKRRFLQLIEIEIDDIINWDYTTSEYFQEIKQKIQNDIKQLEIKFDSNDEIDTIFQNSESIDLPRLRESENWDEAMHLPRFQDKLNYLNELTRNEILINSSMIMEKLLTNDTMTRFFKFHASLITQEKNVDTILQELASVDETFDEFANIFMTQDNNTRRFSMTPPTPTVTAAILATAAPKKKLRWSDDIVNDSSAMDIDVSQNYNFAS
ncbi:hypothetical protein KAFR_0F04210 [Kazachstania africana CBS 2517]|uniref:Kinesin-like protein n=1 Tax=Kazachstania africana (strain ATCC 22294 / BCRC 22015 / CBS 2517 / CECT 1963 / NBRC 1671 / NRRL Y-8276) TaxID=1071382 RepID=H2AXB6_KAZAF|nr:hypothetical protein KAFR_0F04210 [Kazachstania africana CBS 2517]CCF59016.1 hypothetical protein KAFR_0F04210 [Kazachstania africana CBS 2517]